MRVRWSTAARRDLRDIALAIAADNPGRAEKSFIDEIVASGEKLADAPHGYPLVERFATRGIRRRVHGNYLMFYRVEPTRVVVLHVLHGARDYDSLLDIAPDDD